MATPSTSENIGVTVVEIIVVAKKIEDNKLLFLDVVSRTRSAHAHLLLQNTPAHATAHYQVKHLAAVKPSIQHTNAHEQLTVVFAFKLANHIVGICHIAADHFCVLPFYF